MVRDGSLGYLWFIIQAVKKFHCLYIASNQHFKVWREGVAVLFELDNRYLMRPGDQISSSHFSSCGDGGPNYQIYTFLILNSMTSSNVGVACFKK